MIEIMIYKLFLVNIVYKLLGSKIAIKERTKKLTKFTYKNGFKYLALNIYIRSKVNAKSKQINAKNIYNSEKK